MAQDINAIGPSGIQGGGRLTGGQKGDGSFKDILAKKIGEVNELQLDAERAIEALATGKTKNFTEVMAAVEKADLAFRNLMAVRNKIIDAYREIQQLRI